MLSYRDLGDNHVVDEKSVAGRYQIFVTGTNHERWFRLSPENVLVKPDAATDPYLVDTKFAGNSDAYYLTESDYGPQSELYGRLQQKLLVQARNQIELARRLGWQGVRWAVSNMAMRNDLDGFFQANLGADFSSGFLRVYHVPFQ